MNMQLLLISSTFSGSGSFVEHARAAVENILAACPDGEVLFIPYASPEHKRNEYTNHARDFFASLGQSFRSAHEVENPKEYIASAPLKAVFVSGGNTFLLTKTMQELDVLDVLRNRIEQGVGYMSASAGTNFACPTMQTTNDMPIVEPASFKTLGLVPFQINAHYVPGRLIPTMSGETREQRLEEFLDYNDTKVVGLPESTWIRGDVNGLVLGGNGDAVIFQSNQAPTTWSQGTAFNFI